MVERTKMTDSLVWKGLKCVFRVPGFLTRILEEDSEEEAVGYGEEEKDMKRNKRNKREKNRERMAKEKVEYKIREGVPVFSKGVLDHFREDVGKHRAETGGMLASSGDKGMIDLYHFDSHSKNTRGSFYYDVDSMTEVYRKWKEEGSQTCGIVHSHPMGMTEPSFHDISSALLHIDFFGIEYFHMPIVQPDPRGLYTLYLYEVEKEDETVTVRRCYVIKAEKDGSYSYVPCPAYERKYPVSRLTAYRDGIDRRDKAASSAEPSTGKTSTVEHFTAEPSTTWKETPTAEYFSKVSSLFPEKVLEKPIVCIGVGGARSYLESCARCGFRKYVLIDGDVVGTTNVATQGVFISEMGRKKVEVIRDRIMDINPNAEVVCVDKFLDDNMSDEEFKGYLDMFPGRKPTDYLILGCTDNFEAQKRSSLLALKYGIPYIAAMMYKGGAAAEIIFVYPGVTESCPRCLLRTRFEQYEAGYSNDVDSSACPVFATERLNALKGYITLMVLMYGEDPGNPYSRMLDGVKNRNFVQIRLNPSLKDTELGISLFDRAFEGASKYVYFDETVWIHQHPDRPEFGSEPCRLCGGTGHLETLSEEWKYTDTRTIRFDRKAVV